MNYSPNQPSHVVLKEEMLYSFIITNVATLPASTPIPSSQFIFSKNNSSVKKPYEYFNLKGKFYNFHRNLFMGRNFTFTRISLYMD
jgi:hypothetical protein